MRLSGEGHREESAGWEEALYTLRFISIPSQCEGPKRGGGVASSVRVPRELMQGL